MSRSSGFLRRGNRSGAQLFIYFIPAVSCLISLAETISVLLLVRRIVLFTPVTGEKSLLDFHIWCLQLQTVMCFLSCFFFCTFVLSRNSILQYTQFSFYCVLTYRVSRTVCFLTICLLDFLQHISFDTDFYIIVIITFNNIVFASSVHRSQYYGRWLYQYCFSSVLYRFLIIWYNIVLTLQYYFMFVDISYKHTSLKVPIQRVLTWEDKCICVKIRVGAGTPA